MARMFYQNSLRTCRCTCSGIAFAELHLIEFSICDYVGCQRFSCSQVAETSWSFDALELQEASGNMPLSSLGFYLIQVSSCFERLIMAFCATS